MTYIRPLDKIERYVELLAKKYDNCELSFGLKSRYYTIGNKILRISDHVSSASDAYLSIIVPSFSTGGNYVLHAHNGGQISVVDYEKAKEIVRSFFYLSSIFVTTIEDRSENISDKGEIANERHNAGKLIKELTDLEKYKKKSDSRTKTVLGVPIGMFTKGQLKSIQSFVNQVENKKKNSD